MAGKGLFAKIWAGLAGDRHRDTRNAKVAAALRAEGDSLDQPRRVRHWAYFPNESAQARFIAMLGLRFEEISTDSSPVADANMQGVTFWHVGLPDEASMTPITDMLRRFATECDGEYDGWETQVVR